MTVNNVFGRVKEDLHVKIQEVLNFVRSSQGNFETHIRTGELANAREEMVFLAGCYGQLIAYAEMWNMLFTPSLVPFIAKNRDMIAKNALSFNQAERKLKV